MFLNYFTKKVFKACLLLFFSLMFCSIAQAEEVKYFSSWDCGYSYIKFNENCKFVHEMGNNDFAKAWSYYEVHYEDGKLINAVWFQKSKFNENPPAHSYSTGGVPIVGGKLEFDSKERIIIDETLERVIIEGTFQQYRLCKYKYGKQVEERKCYDKNDYLFDETISYYENNILVKTLGYERGKKLNHYTTLDHKTWIIKTFSPDHKLLEEKNIGWYFD